MAPQTTSAAKPVSRRSMADQVVDTVRDMILVGELKPHQKVTHDELAELLGVSTMPIREALLRLSYEGLLEVRPSRFYRVAAQTRNDVQDIYWLHGILAGELTARAAKAADASLVDELTSIQAQWSTKAVFRDTERLEQLNQQFHRAINRAAHSPKLLVQLRNTLRFIPEHFYSLLPAWREMSIRSHGAILEAIATHDASAGKKLATAHVQEAGALLIGYFDDLGYWLPPKGS